MQRYPADIDVCGDVLKGTSVFQGVAFLTPITHMISENVTPQFMLCDDNDLTAVI